MLWNFGHDHLEPQTHTGHPSLCAPWSAHAEQLLLKMSIQCRNGCVGIQGSQELNTVAVKRCSNAGTGGGHNALQKKRGEKTWVHHSASEKRSPLSNQNTLLV